MNMPDAVQRAKIRDDLLAKARQFGVAVEEHAADTIADMKTSARDSILRMSGLFLCIGLIAGIFLHAWWVAK